MIRIKTGIPGLDSMISGGIPKGYTVAIKGAPGTGKTILSLQYLINGIKNENDVGFYLSFEENVTKLKNTAYGFGWDIDALIDEKFFIEYLPGKKPFEILSDITDMVSSVNTSRFVLDSFNRISLNTEDKRKFAFELINALESLDITSFFLSERKSLQDLNLIFDELDFVCDGMFMLDMKLIDGIAKHYLYVEKLRATLIDKGMRPFSFSSDGIVVDTEKTISKQVEAFVNAFGKG